MLRMAPLELRVSMYACRSAPSPIGGARHLLSVLVLMLLGFGCASDGAIEFPDRASDSPPPAEATRTEPDGERVFTLLPTDFPPVTVRQEPFTQALVNLVLEMPLRVSSLSSPSNAGRRWVRTAGVSRDTEPSGLAQGYGHFCAQRGTPGDCLSRLEDGPELDAADKRGIALALAVGPALEAAGTELRGMLSPTKLAAMVSISMAAYMALLLAPEPFSKGVAAAATVLLWSYLGWEFWDLIRAYLRLSEESAQATHFEQLVEAGNRFAETLGPNSVRIIVMVGTAAIGGTASLSSKAPKLPGFAQAMRSAELHGVRAATATAGAERVILSVPEGSIRAVLPRHAMAMSTRGTPVPPRAGGILSTSSRAFKSFSAFKRALGSAGEGKNWHHIVEQHAANLEKFGPEALHNTENIIKLSTPVHQRVSAFYSSIQRELTNSTLTVREWLSTQSYEAQRQFGLRVIENIQKGIW
jgi:hypothetical protein